MKFFLLSTGDFRRALRNCGLVFLLLLASCQFRHAVVLPSRDPETPPIRDQYAFVILMDGSKLEGIQQAIAQGAMPTFQKLFYEQGASVERALTVFPTVSTPAHQSFLSGLQPGHHGVPALDWFSRPLQRHIDYLKPKDVSITTTFSFNFLQLLDGRVWHDEPQILFRTLRGHPTMSVFETSNYGVSHQLPEKPPFVVALKSNIGKFYENWGIAGIHAALDALESYDASEFPRFTMVSLYDMDLTTHFEGPKSQRVMDLFLLYDRFLTDLKALLEKRGIWDKTTIVVVSDHGQHALHGMVDLPKMLFRLGFHTAKNDFKQTQIVWGDHGTGVIGLYLKKGDDWNTRPTYEDLQDYPLKNSPHANVIQTFLQEADIELVIAPEGPWKTHLHAKDGHAVILRRWEKGRFLYAYRVLSGKDPLHYQGEAKLAGWIAEGRFLDAEAWLQATYHLPRPDAVVGISQVFDDYRAGDLIVMTYPEKQFKEDKPYGHGSLESADRNVPIFFHGAGIRPGRYATMRSVDLYPTLLALFGLRSEYPMDGVARREFLQDSYLKNLHPLVPQGRAMSVGAFRDFLRGKLKETQLEELEREKVRQVLYSLEAYLEDLGKYSMPSSAASNP